MESPEALRDEITRLSAELISCNVQLNGNVAEGTECWGSVQVDGAELPCNSPDGWRMSSRSSIEITGSACAELKEKPTATIKAEFACDTFIVF
jgi:hypothetical protein